MVSESEMRQAEQAAGESTDWLAAEREVDAAGQNRFMRRSKPPATKPSSETSGSATPGRFKETASRQQTRPDQTAKPAQPNSAKGDARHAGVAAPERPADSK